MDWKVQIDHVVPKLSSAWYAIRTLKQGMSQETLIRNDMLCLFSLINDIRHNILG